jgi:hypothetical protein
MTNLRRGLSFGVEELRAYWPRYNIESKQKDKVQGAINHLGSLNREG